MPSSDDRLTHASFFSGVGGLDLGLERAGWRTVSFSEIDPYASAVLAQRWPGVPNLGSIVDVAENDRRAGERDSRDAAGLRTRLAGSTEQHAYHRATLWTGGFPCQDLSVAGKRRGMGEGTRSGLAYSFLALAERHRPRFVLLENVPGLLSSHGGRDMAALLGALVELGYGVGYRILDARYFGVPQRRRRVFILGDSLGGRAGAERASEVLSVGSRCRRHPPTGIEAGEGVAGGFDGGAVPALTATGAPGYPGHNGRDEQITITGHGVAADGATSTRTLGASMGHHGYTLGAQDADGGYLQVATRDGLARSVVGANRYDDDTNTFVYSGSPDDARGQGGRRQGSADLRGHEPDDGHGPDADPIRRAERAEAIARGVRKTHGLAGRLDDRGGLAATLNSGGNDGGFRTEPGEHLVAYNPYRTLERDGSVTSGYGVRRDVVDALHGPTGNKNPLFLGGQVADDPLLPLGLDSHRYRCCGNGVVSDVSEWIGHRLASIVSL